MVLWAPRGERGEGRAGRGDRIVPANTAGGTMKLVSVGELGGAPACSQGRPGAVAARAPPGERGK